MRLLLLIRAMYKYLESKRITIANYYVIVLYRMLTDRNRDTLFMDSRNLNIIFER